MIIKVSVFKIVRKTKIFVRAPRTTRRSPWTIITAFIQLFRFQSSFLLFLTKGSAVQDSFVYFR